MVIAISIMPHGASSTAWFEELFGFQESGSYSDNQAHFRMEGETLVCDGAPEYKRHFVGRWSTPSLSELRAELASCASSRDCAKSLELCNFEIVVQLILVCELPVKARE